jgi:acetyl-CoA acetyltransferase
MPYQLFTLPALRFLTERGMTERDLAEVVVAQRTWSAKNPRAMRRELTSVEQVLDGPMIAYPFRKEMCCVVSDGGGALVLTSAERAADLPSAARAVYVLGSGESAESTMVSQLEDLGSSKAFRCSSSAAFSSAGLSHHDIDHLMCYDAFAHVPLYMLEDLGFVGRGESGEFVAAGHTLFGGSLPMNTNGGGLNYTHTGMYGMFAIQESVRQLRGEAEVQVPDVKTSFVQGVGMFFASAASLILGTEPL